MKLWGNNAQDLESFFSLQDVEYKVEVDRKVQLVGMYPCYPRRDEILYRMMSTFQQLT